MVGIPTLKRFDREGDSDMGHQDGRFAVAAVEGIIGWEWLISGANKLISGVFPSGLAAMLSDGLKRNPNSWYVAFVMQAILPHSVVFGYLIEVTETLIGVALLTGAVGLLSALPRPGEPQYRIALAQSIAAATGALAAVFLCVNFHFFVGDGLFPGVNPANAFGEGVDLDTLVAPLALVLLLVNLARVSEMTHLPLRALPQLVIRRVLGSRLPAHNEA